MGKGIWLAALCLGCAPVVEPAAVRVPEAGQTPVPAAEWDRPVGGAVTVGDVVEHFAPVWYHDAASGGPDGLGSKADFPSQWDYDGDAVHNNNWEHLAEPDIELTATIYYAFAATDTHYFITYTQYHARDWESVCTGVFTECHEGDLEDVRIIVERAPDGFGRIAYVITDGHGHKLTWSEIDTDNAEGPPDYESADGAYSATFSAQHSHVRIYTQEKGHGPIACRAHETAPFAGYPGYFSGVHCDGAPGEDGFAGNDGVILRYQRGIATPYSYALAENRATVDYQLISYLDSFWPRRYDIAEGSVFKPDDTLTYDGARDDDAFRFETPIGLQLDSDQFLVDTSGNIAWKAKFPNVNQGDLFFDPAFAIWQAYSPVGEWSLDYVYNPYVQLSE